MHDSIVQVNTFAPAPNMSLLSDEKNMSVREVVFMRSCTSGYVPSFFRGSCQAVSHNIDRTARHMGFDHRSLLFVSR